MSTTPLLAGSGLTPTIILQDHPIFLRVCHSPYRCVPQNVLTFLRGLVLAYLVATGCMVAQYEITEVSEYGLLRLLFDFSLICFGMVFLYHLIAFAWTFTHLYHPEPSEVEGRCERWIVVRMSLPDNMGSPRKQFYFNLFYITTTVFCFMNSTIYWFITRQHEAGAPAELATVVASKIVETSVNVTSAVVMPNAPFSDLFGEGWFKAFIVINLFGVTSLIMVFEILCLNSIKRPLTVVAHILCLIFFAGLYLAWAFIGKLLCGYCFFFWMDETKVGSKEAVSLYCIGFVLLAPIMYTLMQGLVGIREALCRPPSNVRGSADEALDS